MNSDSPIIEEVRQRRNDISAQFDHDLNKYYEHLVRVQSSYGTRLVNQVAVVSTVAQSDPTVAFRSG